MKQPPAHLYLFVLALVALISAKPVFAREEAGIHRQFIVAQQSEHREADAATVRSSQNLASGLSFYAPFDGSTDALLAGGDHRAMNPGLHFAYTDGRVGKALQVSEKNKSTAPEYHALNNLSETQGTVAFWFKPEWNASDPIPEPWTNRWFISSRAEHGRFYFFCLRSVIAFDYYLKVATPHWRKNHWYHVALSWDRSGATLYLDGRSAGRTNLKAGWNHDLRLGESFTVGSYQTFPAGGAIDELGIWRRPLSPAEIAVLYARGAKGEGILHDEEARQIAQQQQFRPIITTPNVIENGSFEAGPGHWLQISMPSRLSPALPSFVSPEYHQDRVSIDEAAAIHGKRSLRLRIAPAEGPRPNEGTATIDMLAFRLNPEQSYVVSYWIKVTADKPLNAALSLNALRPTEARPANLHQSITVRPGDSRWHQLRVAGKPPSAYDDDYRLKLTFRNTGADTATVLVDAIQVSPVESGPEAKQYLYAYPITATLSTAGIANILDAGSRAMLVVTLANQSDQKQAADLTLEVYDLWGDAIFARQIRADIGGAERAINDYEFAPRKMGLFRAILTRESDNQIVDEMTFAVLPKMKPLDTLGVHATVDDYILSVAKRLGIKWHRLWDNGRPTDWPNVQPERLGDFKWEYADAMIEKSSAYGFQHLGVISWPQTKWVFNWIAYKRPHWMHLRWNPTNADSLNEELFDDPEFRRAWLNYVYEVVSHYKDKIEYWELLNEPYLDHTPEWVIKVYDATVPLIRRANPNAKIVGPSTHLRPQWMRPLLAQGLLRYIDVFSYHGYGMDFPAIEMIGSWASFDGKDRPIFDTENSAQSSSQLFCKSCLGAEFSGYVSPDEGAARMSKSLVRALAGGTATYFYYWMVSYDAYEKSGSFLNFDGSVRPPAIAFAITGWLLRDHFPAGKLALGKGIETYRFGDKNGTKVMAVIWCEGEPQWLQLPADAGLRLFDMFANPYLPEKTGREIRIKLTKFPLYIEAGSRDELASVLRNAKVRKMTGGK